RLCMRFVFYNRTSNSTRNDYPRYRLIRVQFALSARTIITVFLSLLPVVMISEFLHLDKTSHKLGVWIGNQFMHHQQMSISQSFVTASLIVVPGAMVIIGVFDSGKRKIDHETLMSKAIIGGFIALVLTTTLEYRVNFLAF